LRIAIIGASSQVGSSLAFYLKHFTNAEPVCFIRSSYSSVFFESLELEYKIVQSAWVQNDFADIDAVIDCTYPSGQLYEIKNIIGKQLTALFGVMRPGTTFIYLSTIMAFGMPDGYNAVNNFAIPRSTYAYLKRFAEKKVTSLSREYKIPAFNFRLGQVHGFLQSVNTSYREKFAENREILLDGAPGSLVNIIFINTLAEAVLKACSGQLGTGTWSLVNHPQWTLTELYDYYKKYYSLKNNIRFMVAHKASLKQNLKNSLLKKVKNYRSLLESYFLINRKNLYIKFKGKYRVLNVKAALITPERAGFTDFHLLGKNPGRLIEGMQASPETVFNKEKEMEARYNSLLNAKTVVAV
jgi:nucleoside-diphosphate-sugar epimerase